MAVPDVRFGNSAQRAEALTEPQPGNGQRPAVSPLRDTEALFPRLYGDLATVEARLRQAIHSPVPVVPEVFLHTVDAGGKRVRPALSLLASRALGQVSEATFDVAVSMELTHLASLIHDDVIDDGGHRRGRLTANRVWGNKSAVLVADYLHAVVYRLICNRCGPAVLVRLSETVARMVEGELAQMYNEGSLEVGEPLYYRMIGDKTASLMALSCELGALVSGADNAVVEAFRDYGDKVGLAFQIVDDLLDLTGDEERLGKPVGNDIRCGRLTLPFIHALQQAGPTAHEALRALICRADLDAAGIRAARDLVEESGGVDYAIRAAERLAEEARAALPTGIDAEAREALEALTHYIVSRTR